MNTHELISISQHGKRDIFYNIRSFADQYNADVQYFAEMLREETLGTKIQKYGRWLNYQIKHIKPPRAAWEWLRKGLRKAGFKEIKVNTKAKLPAETKGVRRPAGKAVDGWKVWMVRKNLGILISVKKNCVVSVGNAALVAKNAKMSKGEPIGKLASALHQEPWTIPADKG